MHAGVRAISASHSRHGSSAPRSHSMVLKQDGRVYTTGAGGSGQLGHGTLHNKKSFTEVASGECAHSPYFLP